MRHSCENSKGSSTAATSLLAPRICCGRSNTGWQTFDSTSVTRVTLLVTDTGHSKDRAAGPFFLGEAYPFVTDLYSNVYSLHVVVASRTSVVYIRLGNLHHDRPSAYAKKTLRDMTKSISNCLTHAR